jgi:hypothetical protein
MAIILIIRDGASNDFTVEEYTGGAAAKARYTELVIDGNTDPGQITVINGNIVPVSVEKVISGL